jgi:hypothetical protein
MKNSIRPSRLAALATGLVLASGAFLSAPSAQARPRTSSKTYKAGAVALGVLGGYLITKGKTVEGAAAVGGGYLAYKKGQKVANQERYGRYDNQRYGYNNGGYNNGGYNNGGYNNGGYNNGGYNNGGYNNGGYNNGDVYPDGGNANYSTNNRNQSGDWNSGWRGNAAFRPESGNNGHHYGQYKHEGGHGHGKKNHGDRDDD